MNNLVLASSPTEAASLEEARTRLAEIAGTLGMFSSRLIASAANPLGGELAKADQGAVVEFVEKELLPIAAAIAGAFPAGSGDAPKPGGLKTEGLKTLATIAAAHSSRLATAARNLEVQDTLVKMVHADGRLQEAVTAFIADATGQILPALAQSTSVALAEALPARAVTTARSNPAAASAGSQVPASGGCACGGHDEPGLAELDTRVIPHAIRHATIFGALEGLSSGKGILLIANHNPLPLLAQLEQRSAGKFDVNYVENGPGLWKLSMVRNQSIQM